ncbi:GABA permease [Fusarium phyllophilum]|uniref:GABA permease n=1 Tax=Fusarium phyllophilum TaxID=47803 RepID=A0A8H5JEH6_9HYPO|nr:GABA permease [Fusarium phyllophilum]
MSALASIASFAWALSSSICTIIGLFTGWVPTNPIIFAVAIAACAVWFFTASTRMDKASLVFIASATLVLVSSVCFVIGPPVAQKTHGIPFTSAATVFGDYTNYSDWDMHVYVPFTFLCPMERWGLKAAGTFLLIIFLNTSIGGTTVLVTMSCPTAAFARDGRMLFNDKLSYVSPRRNMPIYTTMFLTVGGMLMLCLGFSPIASETIYSLAVMVLYALPMIFRAFDNRRWVLGPWNMGRLSKPVHVFGFMTAIYMTIMELFPPQADWIGATLNFNWAVFLGAVLLSALLAWREREHDRGLN